MSQYMLLLRAEDRVEDIEHPDDAFEQMLNWARDLNRRKLLQGVSPLIRDDAKTVRYKKGDFVVDGPFAEGKEAVLGYFIITADSMEAAIKIFSECPGLHWECGEVVRLGHFPL